MHPEADALLDAIFAEPDDDTPRLVYADWLEEHGQSNYAQFIRLQCAAARHTFWTPEANDLWEQIGRVWTRLSDEWRYLLVGFERLDASHFDRGFPRHPVSVSMAEFLGRSHFWWPPDPFVRLLISPRDGELWWTRSVAVPFARHLRELEICAGHGDGLALDSLFRAPMPHLQHLDLTRCGLSDTQLVRLATPGLLPATCRVRLRADLQGTTIADALNRRFGSSLCWGPGYIEPSDPDVE